MSLEPADGTFPAVPGYRLLDLIASTGTVEVYRARHMTLGHEVAVKILRCQIWGGGERRFLDGARIQASLQHPGVVPVHEVGELPDGRPYLAMKLVRGSSLAEIVAERPKPRVDSLVQVFRQACDVVAYAHSRGVVHRDLKPRNVMIGAFGEVQLISWSLAFVRESPTQEGLAGRPGQAGLVMGTPAYMPPEQARGEPADERSDVFGLGGILCHILTGEPPFRGAQLIDIIQAAAAGDLSDAFTRLDTCGAAPEFVALCKRCLDPDRANRPADGGAVARLAAQVTV